jgi:hypothetical protein
MKTENCVAKVSNHAQQLIEHTAPELRLWVPLLSVVTTGDRKTIYL